MPKLKFKMSEFLLFDIFLEYQIAETTRLNAVTFLETTRELLEEADYEIKVSRSGVIHFSGFASKNDLSRITDGKFEFIPGQIDDVILTYYQSLIGPLIIMIVLSMASILIPSPGVLLILIPFGLQEIVRANKLKRTAERIISVVADPT